jgi:hypothetical protein
MTVIFLGYRYIKALQNSNNCQISWCKSICRRLQILCSSVRKKGDENSKKKIAEKYELYSK